MRKALPFPLLFSMTLVFLISVRALAQSPPETEGDRILSVMTWNVYHGVDTEIFDVLNATDAYDLALRVAAVFEAYGETDFPGRAAAVAREIDQTRPDLVGLQEVILVRTQSPADGPATRASDVAIDVLELILEALETRGLHYEVLVESAGFDAELPSAFGFDVRHTNRDVILARTDLPRGYLKVSSRTAAQFSVNCVIPTFFGPVTLTRAWAAVDMAIRGMDFRMISTHLESDCGPFSVPVRAAQAGEVFDGPAATDRAVLLVGDFNSPADGTGFVYNGFRAAGFGDAWADAGLGFGFTCCQLPDLSNGPSFLSTRIDFIFPRGPWTALNAVTVGDDPLSDKTPGGLWPSDHAGVVARMKLSRP